MKRLTIGMLLLSTVVAKAEFVGTKDYLETCSARDTEHHIACVGYIAGVTDSYLHAGQFCIPQRTDPKEVSIFVVDFILRNRQIQRETPVGMILLALKARYPCVNSGPNFRFNFQIR
jgi:hypothetical protein